MKIGYILTTVLLIITALWSSISAYKLKHENKDMSTNLDTMRDSLGRNIFKIVYLEDLVKVNQKEFRDHVDFSTLKALSLDNSTKSPVNLQSLLINKNTLILRYTEIGCNACVDSVLGKIDELKELRAKFQILVIVDFTNNEYFQKWRKITEITLPVIWVKKGDINIPAERTNNSYLFVVSRKLNIENIFIPKSQHVDYLRNYLQDILSNEYND